MSSVSVSQYDLIRLKDGRTGTVLEIYQIPGVPVGYEVELEQPNEEGDYDLITVKLEDIAEVL